MNTPDGESDECEGAEEGDNRLLDEADGGVGREEEADIQHHVSQQNAEREPVHVDDGEERDVAGEIIEAENEGNGP